MFAAHSAALVSAVHTQVAAPPVVVATLIISTIGLVLPYTPVGWVNWQPKSQMIQAQG